MNIFETIYFIGVFVAFVLLLTDYIILNLKLGVSINSVFVFLYMLIISFGFNSGSFAPAKNSFKKMFIFKHLSIRSDNEILDTEVNANSIISMSELLKFLFIR